MFTQAVTRAIQYGHIELTITMTGESVQCYWNKVALYRRLSLILTGKPTVDEREWSLGRMVNEYADLMSQTTAIKEHPEWLVTDQATDADICASFEVYKSLPYILLEAWEQVGKEANMPPGDPELAPPKALSDDQKKVVESKTNVKPTATA